MGTTTTRPAVLSLIAFMLASPSLAAELRFVSLIPTPERSVWLATVDGDGAPVFAADGAAVAVEPDVATSSYRLSGVPEDARTLSIVGRRNSVAAVPIGAQTKAEAPFNDWVVYHIMMGYFKNGSKANDKANMRRWIHNNYAGGDLQGVLQQVDYLADLGINALWLSPIFASDTSHGYDIKNYYQVGDAVAIPNDPDASMALFDELVTTFQARGIRIVLDMPLNHVSQTYDRKSGDPNQRKPRSTRAQQEAEKVWESWGSGFKYWNFNDDSTRQFLTEVGLYWLVEKKVDGLRLDYVRGVPHDFWAEFYAEVKAAKPQAFLYGEAWQDAQAQEPNAVDIATYYEPVEPIGRQFDSLLDFPMQLTMTEVFARGASAVELESWLQRTAALYGAGSQPIYFLDNHDVARFMSWAKNSGSDRLLAAITFMASLSSPMVIFYGTETGILGGSAQPGFTDNGRIAMPWNKLDGSLIGRISHVFETRSAHPSLTHGGRLPLLVSDELLVMAKHTPTEVALIGVNLSNEVREVSVSIGELAAGSGGFEAVLGDSAPVLQDEAITWQLPPLRTSVAIRSGE